MGGRRLGVEEELLLVDPVTGVASGVSTAVLRAARGAGDSGTSTPGEGDSTVLAKELQQEQVETATAPVSSLDELNAELVRRRRAASVAAGEAGVRVAALATSPLPVVPNPHPDDRYQALVEMYRLTAAEQLACGMHVHVEVASPEEGVGILDRIRPWLPVLRALSTNSPFWQGQDTGYQSYRTQAWSRWPTAGPNGVFGSLAAYRAVTDAAVATGAVVDDGQLYFDARLGRGLPTVELRVTDVCLDVRDAVLLAAMSRALVETAARALGEPPDPTPTEVLRLAHWRAGRSGLRGALVHPESGREAPAWDVVAALRRHVADALDSAGDSGAVHDHLTRLRRDGTGAEAQRASFERTGELSEVVADAVRRTVDDR